MAEGGQGPIYFYESRESEKEGKTYVLYVATTVGLPSIYKTKEEIERQATKQLDKVFAEELQKWNNEEKNQPKFVTDEFKRVRFGSSEAKDEAEYQLDLLMTAGVMKKLEDFKKYFPMQESVWMTFPKEVAVEQDGTRKLNLPGISIATVDANPDSPPPDITEIDEESRKRLLPLVLALGASFGLVPDPVKLMEDFGGPCDPFVYTPQERKSSMSFDRGIENYHEDEFGITGVSLND